MKYDFSHYPNSGIQHTRAVVALTTAQICLELYKVKSDSEFAKYLSDIQKAIKSCSTETKKKKLSAGAERSLNNCSLTLAPYIEDQNIPSDKLIWHWGSIVWCALTFIEDVLATCPQYVDGHKRKWQNLHKLMDDLAGVLMEMEKDKHEASLDEAGTLIYEKAAWAMDGIVFRSQDTGSRQ